MQQEEMQQELTPEEIARKAERVEAEAYHELLAGLLYERIIPIKLDGLHELENHRPWMWEDGNEHARAFVAEEFLFRTKVTHRVLCLGMDEPATEDSVGAIFRLYDRYGSPFRIHVTPYSQPAELSRWITDRQPGAKSWPGVDKFLWDPASEPGGTGTNDYSIVRIDEGAARDYA